MSSLLLIVLFTFLNCKDDGKTKKKNELPTVEEPVKFDLSDIKKAGVLKAITTYSPTGYFLYKGETMGFEYEMLERFAEYIDVNLEIIVAKNVDSVIPMLNRGDGDLIALGLTISNDRKEKVSFTDPYLITHQTLVQKKPDNWRKMTLDNIKKQLATDIIDIIGDTVSVRRESSYYARLEELSGELGDTIYIDILPGELTDEETIKMVADGLIKYTIVDDNIANVYKNSLPNIDISTPVSLSQRLAWAVRKSSPELLDTINAGLSSLKKKSDYNVIYKKYFEDRRQFKRRIGSDYFTSNTGKISKHDDLVKKYSKNLGWDWVLVKSLIYQESRFEHTNKSWAGANGLMQLMPATAKELGVTNVHDPDQNIKAGTKYLKRMYSYWDNIPDTIQRVKFAMASYNCGYGHVKDAQRLAMKFNKDSLSWDNGVDFYVLNLSKPEYYNDDLVKFGYARGIEPYEYVDEIFDRYENYKDFIQE
jgi:membrane-bound lytic murein transglycosylase F